MEFFFYTGIMLFIIGTWQAFMHGTHSEVISGTSLILGTIFVFIGNWLAGLFFVFLFASWFLLMQLYRFSTYHSYFLKTVIFLVGYAVLTAFLLKKFGFSDFIWWYLVLTIFFLIVNHRKQHIAKKPLRVLSEKESVEEKDTHDEMVKSCNRSIKYHLLSSIVYLAVLVLVFMYMF